jgi:hypothetical protein
MIVPERPNGFDRSMRLVSYVKSNVNQGLTAQGLWRLSQLYVSQATFCMVRLYLNHCQSHPAYGQLSNLVE